VDSMIKTKRLILRQITQDDFTDLCEILQDADVMYFWEHTFSESQVQEWIDRQLKRYEQTGVGVWIAIEKETGKTVGQIGLVYGDIEGEDVLELTYMLKKAYWGKGFAFEGGKACLDYAFKEMKMDKVYAPIRPENQASVKVAEKLGFEMHGEYFKHYNGKDMRHLIYVIDKQEINVIEPISEATRELATAYIRKKWLTSQMLIRDEIIDCTVIDGFIILDESRENVMGLVTYIYRDKVCEIVSLNSERPHTGIGTALIEKVKESAIAYRCKILRLLTSNDNLNAIGFYQKRGFELVGLRLGAIDRERESLNPQIPMIGHNGIPIHHEIDFSLNLVLK